LNHAEELFALLAMVGVHLDNELMLVINVGLKLLLNGWSHAQTRPIHHEQKPYQDKTDDGNHAAR